MFCWNRFSIGKPNCKLIYQNKSFSFIFSLSQTEQKQVVWLKTIETLSRWPRQHGWLTGSISYQWYYCFSCHWSLVLQQCSNTVYCSLHTFLVLFTTSFLLFIHCLQNIYLLLQTFYIWSLFYLLNYFFFTKDNWPS